MEYKVNDQELDASLFISFVNQIWKGGYDIEKTQKALSKTINITAYSDSTLLQLAKDNTPTMLYFGAQPGIEPFYEKNGCQKSLQSYMIEKER